MSHFDETNNIHTNSCEPTPNSEPRHICQPTPPPFGWGKLLIDLFFPGINKRFVIVYSESTLTIDNIEAILNEEKYGINPSVSQNNYKFSFDNGATDIKKFFGYNYEMGGYKMVDKIANQLITVTERVVESDLSEQTTQSKIILQISNLSNGSPFQVSVYPDDSILTLKKHIQELTAVSLDSIRVIWKAKEMSNDRTIQDYGITDGSRIHWTQRIKAGPYNPYDNKLPSNPDIIIIRL